MSSVTPAVALPTVEPGRRLPGLLWLYFHQPYHCYLVGTSKETPVGDTRIELAGAGFLEMNQTIFTSIKFKPHGKPHFNFLLMLAFKEKTWSWSGASVADLRFLFLKLISLTGVSCFLARSGLPRQEVSRTVSPTLPAWDWVQQKKCADETSTVVPSSFLGSRTKQEGDCVKLPKASGQWKGPEPP